MDGTLFIERQILNTSNKSVRDYSLGYLLPFEPSKYDMKWWMTDFVSESPHLQYDL